MKKNLSLFLLLFHMLIFAQNKTLISNWTSYVQSVNVEDKQNQNFRVTAKMRKDNNNNGSNCGIWCRVDKTDGKNGFFENQYYTVQATNEWKIYEIKGVIDPTGKLLNIGAFAQDNGDFYFDDFKLELFNGKSKKWIEVPLKNSGFEENLNSDNNWYEGIYSGETAHIKHFNIESSAYQPASGKKSLLIRGRNIIGTMPEGKFADVNGVKLYYEIYGEGEPLLMLHGNGQSISAFINQVEDFSRKYKVILVDCRGRGKSAYDKNKELTFDLQTEDLKQFLDKLGIKKTKILGWSDGGILAISLALKYPELTDKIACSGANIFPEGIKDDELKSLKEYKASLVSSNRNHQNDLLIDLLDLDIKYPNWKFEDLKNIQCPSLIIAGDKDMIKTEHTVKIAEFIPKGQLAVIPKSSHFVPEEKPTIFNQLVLDFFEDK
ncbi:pimeloyl-ACP methyl ester carboxylesterase [Chryseobacterium defluvii]|uniref:Pimeloyl-ACP methyl ester carboxylesterase n=1 Tax=Chryseobacterium defluvii TaxID=160396 RepID=A0A840KE45_9FLAO|nr:alpha/beta hydrolase [Chryseobacterium defluvii]MBB4806855.1 pimeloyl-ACP methyl ester carboxylesterase [Chryseobacterium defluvii]